MPNIAPAEAEFFFKKMDVNGDGLVSLQELENKFVEHQIPLTSKFHERVPFLLDVFLSFNENGSFNESILETPTEA